MKKAGFSLIELLIAMAVLITMLLSIETLYVNTLRVTQKNKLKNQAQSLARKTMEEYKSLDFEKLKAINGDVPDGQVNQSPGTNFNKQISVDFVDRDWVDEDNDGDQNELVKTDNETNIMKLRVVISDRKQPKRIDDTVLETLVSEGGHTNLPQFKITASPEITNAGSVAITIRSSEALDPTAASGNPLDVTTLFADGTNSGNIYTSGEFYLIGANQWTGTFAIFDSTVDGNATIIVRGRSMPGQPVGLWGMEKKGILIDTYSPTYRDLVPLTGSLLSNRRPLISVIFKDEGDTSYTPIPKPSLLDPGSLSIKINDEELTNASKITQADDPGLSECELKINYFPTTDLPDGGYTVNITISDLAGNDATASTNFTIAGATVSDNAKPVIYPTLPMNLITGQVSTDPALPVIITDLKPTISAKIEDLPAEGASGIDLSSIVLTLDGSPVTHTYSVIQVSWTPSSNLSLDHVYEVTMNLNDNGVDFTDDSGTGPPDGDKDDTTADGVWEHPNSADEAKWYFKITIHPIVTAVYPPNGENLNSKIIVTFNKEMDVQSIKNSLSIIGSVSGNITSLVLSQDAVWSSLNKTITFNDNQANILQDNETYTITINNTAKDTDELNTEIAYSWTISTPDTLPPVFWHHNHNPPQDGQIRNTAVTIYVRVQDNIALPQNGTYLYYRNKIGSGFDDWSSWYNIVMTFMYWNETNKDAEFRAVIDQSYVTIPEGLSEGMIQYYFKAEDAVANISCFGAASTDSSWTPEPITSFYSFTIVSPNFIFFDDFEGDKKGWTHNGTKDDWQVGPPQGKGGGYYRGNPDPTSAHSGTKCYGNDLTGVRRDSGNYEYNAANYLTSPEINCTGKTNVHLTFYRWLNVDRNSNDKAYIVVSSGSKWDTAFSNSDTATITDSSWALQAINISSWANGKKKVRIRFGLTSNGSVNYSGWNIDDVTIKEGE